MRWGAGVDWSEDEEAPRPRRAPQPPAGAPPPNRLEVVVVICANAACGSRDVLRHSATAEVSYWRCKVCGQRWKEGAGVGSGTAHIA